MEIEGDQAALYTAAGSEDGQVLVLAYDSSYANSPLTLTIEVDPDADLGKEYVGLYYAIEWIIDANDLNKVISSKLWEFEVKDPCAADNFSVVWEVTDPDAVFHHSSPAS